MVTPGETLLPFIDSHVHLADPGFDPDRDDVIARLRASGARGAVCIGESAPATRAAEAIAARYPGFIWFTSGVHPHNADDYDGVQSEEVIRQAIARGAVAVGECGLDYHYDNTPRLRQRQAFAAQLAIAASANVPVVVHTRDAESDTAAMIKEAGAQKVRGVLHCFTGSAALAEAAIDAGWYISLSGIITFSRWNDQDLIRSLPRNCILVESDGPYLAPVPNRGKRNEPAWVRSTLGALSNILGLAPFDTARLTCTNTASFFGLDVPAP